MIAPGSIFSTKKFSSRTRCSPSLDRSARNPPADAPKIVPAERSDNSFHVGDRRDLISMSPTLKVFKADPFAVLDQEGVGKLVEMAVKLGRKSRPDLEIGICGEHGGEPSSVAFCYRVGMDYVSCSPYRVPIARLAAAQAAISGDKSEAARTA